MPLGGQDPGLAHFSMYLAAEEIEQHTHALTTRKELCDHCLKPAECAFNNCNRVTLANVAFKNRQLILIRLTAQSANRFLVQSDVALPETEDRTYACSIADFLVTFGKIEMCEEVPGKH